MWHIFGYFCVKNKVQVQITFNLFSNFKSNDFVRFMFVHEFHISPKCDMIVWFMIDNTQNKVHMYFMYFLCTQRLKGIKESILFPGTFYSIMNIPLNCAEYNLPRDVKNIIEMSNKTWWHWELWFNKLCNSIHSYTLENQ